MVPREQRTLIQGNLNAQRPLRAPKSSEPVGAGWIFLCPSTGLALQYDDLDWKDG